MKLIYFLIVMFFQTGVTAQFLESFSDGNLSKNPGWTGDTILFKVHSGELYLSAPPLNGKSSIATPSFAVANAQWEVSLKMDFNPSSSNLLRIYLVSDTPELRGSLNGYFVMAGNTADEVSLYRQTGTSITEIIDGRDKILDTAVNNLKIKVTTDNQGNWKLFTLTDKQSEWYSEGFVKDDSHKLSGWFGLTCIYTSTRSDKFRFDDISVTGSPWPDREPPQLINHLTISDEQVQLEFNEPIKKISVENLENYTFSDSRYAVLDASLNLEGTRVILQITNLSEGVRVQLKISDLSDLSENKISPITIDILYIRFVPTKPRDIIFNELLFDPYPKEGLPEQEFVELYNRSSNYVNMENWQITDGTSVAKFPVFVLPPGKFIVLTSPGGEEELSGSLTLEGFPSLNNSGDQLYLNDANGQLIDSVAYTSDWHPVSGKREGGWSLERINPEDFCGSEDNWTSSIDPFGGTPGKQNSVYSNRIDRTSPKLTDVENFSDSLLLLTFSESLESSVAENIKLTIKPPSGDLMSVSLIGQRQISLRFSRPFLAKQKYLIEVSNVRDCPGNPIDTDYARRYFYVAEEPDSLDVVINEILFNPIPGGNDFVEVFNKSDKAFRLRSWSLSNKGISSKTESMKLFPAELKPGGYLVFTSDLKKLKSMYPNIPDSVIIENDLPTMPDDYGSISIFDSRNQLVDGLKYSKDFHLPMIRNEEGISLERIDPYGSTNSSDNWRSAAFGNATPGMPNSVLVESEPDKSTIYLDPEVFSLGTGIEFVRLKYDFQKTDLFSTVNIFDLDGRLVKQLLNNQNIGSTGFLRWDGDRNDGRLVNPGMYLMVVDVYNDNGYWNRYRFRIVAVK